jgi:hypothetical protein
MTTFFSHFANLFTNVSLLHERIEKKRDHTGVHSVEIDSICMN